MNKVDEKDVFCKIVAGELPSNIVLETPEIISIMDVSPFTPGHVLIIPKKHYTTILDMDDDINNRIQDAARILIKKIENAYPNVTGVKVVVNYGDEQKVKHYHMHLLPIYETGKKPSLSQDEFAELLRK